MSKLWDIEEALAFIRHYQPAVMEAQWCLMLGGGVLNRGRGPDLDLMVYSRVLSADVDDFLGLFTGGEVSDVNVACNYSYYHEKKLLDFIFHRISWHL